MGKPKCKLEPPGDAPKSRLHDSLSETPIEKINAELRSGSKVQCIAVISPHFPHTTRSRAAGTTKVTPSQSEEEEDGMGNEKGSNNESNNEEKSGSENEIESREDENASRC